MQSGSDAQLLHQHVKVNKLDLVEEHVGRSLSLAMFLSEQATGRGTRCLHEHHQTASCDLVPADADITLDLLDNDHVLLHPRQVNMCPHVTMHAAAMQPQQQLRVPSLAECTSNHSASMSFCRA